MITAGMVYKLTPGSSQRLDLFIKVLRLLCLILSISLSVVGALAICSFEFMDLGFKRQTISNSSTFGRLFHVLAFTRELLFQLFSVFLLLFLFEVLSLDVSPYVYQFMVFSSFGYSSLSLNLLVLYFFSCIGSGSYIFYLTVSNSFLLYFLYSPVHFFSSLEFLFFDFQFYLS